MATIETTSCDDSIPYRQLKSIPSGTTWDGLTNFSFSSTGTTFGASLANVSMIWYSSDDSVALTLDETDGITITSAGSWQFDVGVDRLISLAAGTYYWKLKTTDSGGVIKIRLQGTIDVT